MTKMFSLKSHKHYEGENARERMSHIPGIQDATAMEFLDKLDPCVLVGALPLGEGEAEEDRRNVMVIKGMDDELTGLLVGMLRLMDREVVEAALMNLLAEELLDFRLREMAGDVKGTD